MKCVKSSRRTL